MNDLDAWTLIENGSRSQRDDDSHVECRNRFQLSVCVRLCLLFSEQARSMCDEAYRDLIVAQQRAARAHDYLIRTTTTLEQAIRLQAMGRR